MQKARDEVVQDYQSAYQEKARRAEKKPRKLETKLISFGRD
jgi:hypothetical protein